MSSRLWPLVAMAGVAATIFPRLRWINLYEDQAVISGAAMQLAAGQVPYRDFDAIVAPGSIYLYGAYYKLVSATVVHQRLLTGAAMLIGVWLAARIASHVLPAWWAAGVALLWGVWLPVFQEFSQFHFWSVTFVLAMAAALLQARESPHPIRLFVLAGVAASAALVTLQSSLPAVLAGLVVAWMIERRTIRSVLPMVIAVMVPSLIVLAVLGLQGALPNLIRDTLVYNFTIYRPNHSLPFPWQPGLLHDTAFWEASLGALWAIPMHWVLAVLAPVAVTIYVAASLWLRRAAKDSASDSLLIAILAVGLFAAALLVHMSDQNLWLSCALTLVVVTERLRQILGRRPSRSLLAAVSIAPLAAIYLAGLSPAVLGYVLVCHQDGTGFLREVSSPDGPLCVTFESAPTVTAALRFSSDHSHSVIAFLPIAPSLYQITGRTPPVPNIYLVPGLIAPEQLTRVEEAMVGRPVEWVVYSKIDLRKDLPADQALQDQSRFQFDLFLEDRYQRVDDDVLIVYRLNH
jgi:hypothetical protein